MKQRTTIEIDPEIKHKCRQLNIQFGPACESFLRNLVSSYMNDDSIEDLATIEKEVCDIDDKMNGLAIRKTKLMEKKEAILTKIREKQKKKNQETLNLAKSIKNSGVLGELG